MAGSDFDEKMPSATSPQLKPSVSSNENTSKKVDSSGAPSREAVIEDARRFLQEEEVRNAPRNKQIAFLEKKGLQTQEIHELLGSIQNQDSPSSETESAIKSTPPTTTPNLQAPREVPPIITYPEFLTTQTQPAPIITARKLLTTLYLFGGLSALLYGTSNYLIAPMIESLTASRHTLAESTQVNLDKLIAKLKTVVSETPPSLSVPRPEDHEDGEESDSDPTEMFHRDIGVQTSPPTSRPVSPYPPQSTLSDQTTRLYRLKSHLGSLTDDSTSEGHDTADLSTTIGLLRDYLNSLAFEPPPSYTYTSSAAYGSGMTGSGFGQRKDENDEIANLKATIRSVKGVFLSAKSFPTGVSASAGIRKVR